MQRDFPHHGDAAPASGGLASKCDAWPDLGRGRPTDHHGVPVPQRVWAPQCLACHSVFARFRLVSEPVGKRPSGRKESQYHPKKTPTRRPPASVRSPRPWRPPRTGRIRADGESVNPRPEFDWSKAIAATPEGNVNKLAAKHGGPAGGFNPAQVRRLMAGQVPVSIGAAPSSSPRPWACPSGACGPARIRLRPRCPR